MVSGAAVQSPAGPLPAGFRRAAPGDAAALADLVNFAGEGLPLYLWTQMAKSGQSPWSIGRQRARRESGSFSYRNAVVREDGGRVAAALIGYALPDNPDPSATADPANQGPVARMIAVSGDGLQEPSAPQRAQRAASPSETRRSPTCME